MKISHKELSQIYQAHISGKIPPSTDLCLSLDVLNEFFDAQVLRERKSEMIEHITNCAYCVQKFSLLLEMHRGTNFLSEEMEKCIENNALIRPNRKPYLNPIHASKLLLSKTIIISGIVISSICVSALVVLFLQTSLKKDSLRRNYQYLSQMVDSNSKYSKKSNIQIAWSQNKLAKYFTLEIFDESLKAIWKSQKLYENQCLIYSNLMNEWISNKYYFWMVTGYTETGSVIELPLTKFLLID